MYNNYEIQEEENLSTEDYNHAADHLKGLVEDIYTKGSMDDLEFHLEEVLNVFGMKIPQETPVLMKKPTNQEVHNDRIDQMLQSWVGATQIYANMATK